MSRPARTTKTRARWMGWPLGPHYAASSNMEHAHRLEGELLLIWGELDTNVDPSSSMQVVDALIEADKHFDMLVIPGGDHGAGRRGPTRAYGDLKRNDFFVNHLLGVGLSPIASHTSLFYVGFIVLTLGLSGGR